MKRELNPNVVIAIIVAVVIVAGWLLWRSTDGMLSRPDQAAAYFQQQERELKARGDTMNKGLGAYVYREYVDKSAPPPDLNVKMPAPGGAGAPTPNAPGASNSGSPQSR